MIRIMNFSFKYGKKRVLDNVSLAFPKGEATILAGPNGAGKTTLLRSVCGILKSKEGKIVLDNIHSFHNIRKRIAYIPSSISMYDSLKLNEAIKVHSSFYKGYEFHNIAKYSFDMKQKVSSLSRGEKALFYLSLVLGTDPEFLLIDDVIHFLDPHLRDLFRRSLIEKIENKQISIIIATQDALDLEGLVDRVILINNGKIIEDASLEKIKKVCVRVYSEKEIKGHPVIFSREWGDMKEYYIYPYRKKPEDKFEVEYLNLSEILRAFIGGEYDHH